MEMVWTYDSLNFHGWDMSVSHDSWKVPSKISTKKKVPPVIFSHYAKKNQKTRNSTLFCRLSFSDIRTHIRIYIEYIMI